MFVYTSRRDYQYNYCIKSNEINDFSSRRKAYRKIEEEIHWAFPFELITLLSQWIIERVFKFESKNKKQIRYGKLEGQP